MFLAATGQNRGKTTTSLGLIAAIREGGLRLGFMKPVGQRYLVVDGTRADEDAVLMKEVFHLPDALNDMSPVTLPRRFTTDFIMGRITDDLETQVGVAFRRVAAGKDMVVIEGTGHAGVGAVIGLSNARAAAMLDAPVIIVSEGGVGRPIDEIVLNRALFAAHGVDVLGAVVNKVDVESHPQLPDVLARGLGMHGINLLGCIPYSEFLANPSLELIVTHLGGELLAGRAEPGRTIGHVAIGAMQAEHAISHLADRTLLITPGDREDLLHAALEANRRAGSVPLVSGVILSGGYRPSAPLLAALRMA
ncbi:MAG: AAA family ATPase, partial [Candidatus Limnocylindria bacterium]